MASESVTSVMSVQNTVRDCELVPLRSTMWHYRPSANCSKCERLPVMSESSSCAGYWCWRGNSLLFVFCSLTNGDNEKFGAITPCHHSTWLWQTGNREEGDGIILTVRVKTRAVNISGPLFGSLRLWTPARGWEEYVGVIVSILMWFQTAAAACSSVCVYVCVCVWLF